MLPLSHWRTLPPKLRSVALYAVFEIPVGELMTDKEKYLRWLEEMWDVQKFDVHGNTEREEKRKEEILEVFEDLGEDAKHRTEAPQFPPWASERKKGEG